MTKQKMPRGVATAVSVHDEGFRRLTREIPLTSKDWELVDDVFTVKSTLKFAPCERDGLVAYIAVHDFPVPGNVTFVRADALVEVHLTQGTKLHVDGLTVDASGL